MIVDRDPANPGTIDDSVIFQRLAFTQGDMHYTIAKRVPDRRPDGSLRGMRALCDGMHCTFLRPG